jgi:ubiquinone/menaquinone biosynthesis C-methylase UbiE
MSKETFYDSIADSFDSIMNMYDTNRRIGVIFNDFLGNENLKGKSLLDAGCGTGLFTRVAVERGGDVTSIDIAPKLVELTQKKCPQAKCLVASLLELPFADSSFDYVFSSDVIEHTNDPFAATMEMIRVLKPGGKLCITVPNRTFWYFSVVIANTFKLRKYQGNENWVHYNEFREFLKSKGIEIINYKGIHLFPFLIPFLNPLLKAIDKRTDKLLGKFMVNLAAYGVKK